MDWLSFLTYTVLTAFTPGPNNIMALRNAGHDGFRKTVPFLAGIFVGFSIVMLVCVVFTSLLFGLIPTIEPVMRALGAIYLVFLAYSVWREAPKGTAAGPSSTNSFGSGIILQLVNVKIILYGITALSSFVLPNVHDPWIVGSFGLLLAMIGLSGCLTWAALGRRLERLFQTRQKLLNGILAVLLLFCAASLLLH